MPNINKLDPSVYNLISAGEVVENPASVVKELVENSIDAGATEISIYIEEGGIKQIKIIDNGIGMNKENMHLSYLPHATSKIKEAVDIDKISTLGFRGEALASIAAISQMTIISKEIDNDIGYFIKLKGGLLTEEDYIGTSQGTTIIVDNIFYNTPVRLKFLKRPKQEESLVTSKVIQIILANPDVKFKYCVDNEIVYQTSGGLEDAIYTLYGNNIANKLLEIDFNYNDYRVYGYTGQKDLVKHNKSYETIIVNGRPILNQTIQTAVMQAYGDSLMKRTYPIYVINIIMPFDEVDVNVHPTKAEVRFQDNHKVFSAVYRAILSTINNQSENIDINTFGINPNLDFIENKTYVHENIDKNKTYVSTDDNKNYEKKSNFEQNFDINDNSKLQNLINNTTNKNSNMQIPIKTENKTISNYERFIKTNTIGISNLEEIENNITNSYNIVGQLFETFLIIQDGPKAYLIDQHACHEKFLYEKFISEINKKEIASQPLFIPYILQVNAVQYDYMIAIIDKLKELGFEITSFGDLSFKIDAVPIYLIDINLECFFNNILEEKSIITNLKASDLIKDKLIQHACKAAVKSGDKLSEVQIREMFRQMKNGIPMQCPHGRPCIFEFNRNDLDKLFKRLV